MLRCALHDHFYFITYLKCWLLYARLAFVQTFGRLRARHGLAGAGLVSALGATVDISIWQAIGIGRTCNAGGPGAIYWDYRRRRTGAAAGPSWYGSGRDARHTCRIGYAANARHIGLCKSRAAEH